MAPLGLNVKTTRAIFSVFKQNFKLICFQLLGLRIWQSGCDLYIGRYRDGLGNLRSTWDGAFCENRKQSFNYFYGKFHPGRSKYFWIFFFH